MKTSVQKENIRSFRKRRYFNIGMLIFGIILVYLVAVTVIYLTTPKIDEYEVREGRILKEKSCTGLVLRNEIVVTAAQDGYLNFFQTDNTKVAKGMPVYSLSEEKLKLEEETDSKEMLSDEEYGKILSRFQSFGETFGETQFDAVYSLKDQVDSVIMDASNKNYAAEIQTKLDAGDTSLSMQYTEDDGILVCYTDGMEGLKAEDVTPKDLERTKYKKAERKNNTKVSRGDPVYKLITDDDWSMVLGLDDTTAETLLEKQRENKQNTSTVKIRFSKDNSITTTSMKIEKKEGQYLGTVSLYNSMIRYASDRYLDVQLILEDQEGLKIPKSAKVEKEFYVIPYSYLNKDHTKIHVLSEDGMESKDVSVSIFADNVDENVAYIAMDELPKDAVLVKEDTLTENYVPKETKTFDGVYSINNGYTVFKQINILSEDEDSYIVEGIGSYGLSNYDHIVLDGNTVTENEIVNQ